MNSKTGTLYVVATPIGNLGDISGRARDVLSRVSLVLAEDTRRGGKLLSHLDLSTRMRAFHDHNEKQVAGRVLDVLGQGSDVALISDAGTPLISDPGFSLVARARQAGFPVSPVPGPSALVAALSVAGLPVDRFCFEGFAPSRRARRMEWLAALAGEPRTLVLYESSHRIAASLADMAACFGAGRRAVVCREMTKKFESFYADTLERLANTIGADEQHRKGEFVIVIAGCDETRPDAAAADTLLTELLAELPAKRACGIAARVTGLSRNVLYRRALELGKK